MSDDPDRIMNEAISVVEKLVTQNLTTEEMCEVVEASIRKAEAGEREACAKIVDEHERASRETREYFQRKYPEFIDDIERRFNFTIGNLPVPTNDQQWLDLVKLVYSGASAAKDASIHDYMNICEDLSRKLEEARGRIGELEAALTPFAAEAEKWSSDIHFSDFIPALDVLGSACNNCGDDPGYEEAAFSIADLRNARSKLEGKSE